MPELPKEELDKVFREGAEQYDFPFKPEAWDHMESLLDRDRRRRIAFWWWLGVLGLLVLIFGSGFFYFLRSDQVDQDEMLKHSPQESIVATAPPKTDDQTDNSHTRPHPGVSGQQAESTEIAAAKSPEQKERSKENGLPSAEKTSTPPVSPEASGITAAHTIEKDKTASANPNASRLNKEEINPKTDQAPGKIPVPDSELDGSIAGHMANNTFVLDSLKQELYLLVLPEMDFDARPQLSAVDQTSAQKQAAGRARLIFGATLSPELVSVGTDNFSRLGLKAGLTAEFLYFKRLGISTGVNFLRKSYLAGKGEYHPPYGFWIRKIQPIATDGVCNIIEIPVMMSYYTRGYGRSGWYGSFGASSYIMLKEKYTYEYDVPDTDLIFAWSSKSPTEHWMKLLNFSIGYSAPLSEKLSYRLGVYGQSPLGGVGHGKVHLNSLGVNCILLFQQMEK